MPEGAALAARLPERGRPGPPEHKVRDQAMSMVPALRDHRPRPARQPPRMLGVWLTHEPMHC